MSDAAATAVAAAAAPPRDNPFRSIMTMLCNNKCWLCEGVFARGKIKKVFMVSHLLQLLKEKHGASPDFRFVSPNLQACFEEYCRLAGEEEAVQKCLDEVECATWMSGLICCRTTVCAEEYLLIVPDGKVVVPDAETSKKRQGECPPDCDCDNPWQFVADVLNSAPASNSTTSINFKAPTMELAKEATATENAEPAFAFNFDFSPPPDLQVKALSEASDAKKSKKKNKKKNKKKKVGKDSAAPVLARGDAGSCSSSSSSSSEDEEDAKPSSVRGLEKAGPPKTAPPPKNQSNSGGEAASQKQPSQKKKAAKGKAKEEDNDDDWFDPQPQPQAPKPSTMFVRSSKAPGLDVQAQHRLKFGDGKNLTAIGPPKLKSNNWAGAGEGQQPATSASPFAFGFAFGV